ncbi:terminase TerL endonuclease subunit [Vagococcus vulneris]|uniref:Terminase n=1 Tax=Vagococcus vulneris TaxID=1977869 RepID=A0A429ZTJ8_9ENTE|nr:terminase TerL endonuclease subunit [Vagococcus vulneris]RST96950.1 terminase [Vagococcus vulneris]
MITTKYIDEYIALYESGQIELNKERIQLINWLKKDILNRNDLYFDLNLLESYIAFTKKWYFELESFQKFVASFIFLYQKSNEDNYFKEFFISMARGGGKNGFITSLSHFFISPFHGVKNYNVALVANSEKQAKVSFLEMYNCIKDNKLDKHFYRTKLEILGRKTNSTFMFNTSNAGTKDGARDGCVIFDEVHQYEDQKIVDVLTSGLGKVKHPRIFYIGTDGFVRDKFLDKLKERSNYQLQGESEEDRLFPFICRIDDKKEVDNLAMWQKANPMFCNPMSDYAEGLLLEVKRQYKNLEYNPSARPEFMTKRMNLPEEDLEQTIVPYEEIKATNQEVPDLLFKTCIGGVDYASIRDFAAVGLLFRDGDKYIWKSHSFARKGYLDSARLKAPIDEWERKGLLTILDEESINPKHIVNWFIEMRENYGIDRIVADNFRMDLLRPLFQEAGFEIEVIKNPRAIQSLLAPRIIDGFAQKNIIFGDNPLMRWYTQNVAVKRNGRNIEFLKKDEHRRKTDGFQAFIHSMYRADEIVDIDVNEMLDFMEGMYS